MMADKDWTPSELLELARNFWQSFPLHTAIKLDIFTLIGEKEITADEAAGILKGDLRGVTMLLNALTAMGFLVKKEDRYANTEASRSFLVKGSQFYTGSLIMHMHDLVIPWANLDKVVISGQPFQRRDPLNDDQLENYLMGMYNAAMAIAPVLVKKIDLGGRKHLLDIGGGPGTYAIFFCLENPQLKGTVFDLPATRPFAERTISNFGVSDRVDFQQGDLFEDALQGSYDVAWLSNVLHGEGPESCETILKKAAAVLSPGSLILIHDLILDDSLDGPLQPALFSLNMLVNTESGQVYSEGQIRDMLTRAGFENVKRIADKGMDNTTSIIRAEI